MTTKQVKFSITEDDGEEVIFGGILVDDWWIICGCCGSVFDIREEENLRIIEKLPWTPITEEILGN